VRDIIRTELRNICEAALWRVRAFLNPLHENGEEVPGQRAMDISLVARQPILCPDGQPVTVWQRDATGKRVGEAPLPLKAEYCLRIVSDVVRLVTA
jgi:hypothetical protein